MSSEEAGVSEGVLKPKTYGVRVGNLWVACSLTAIGTDKIATVEILAGDA